MLILAPSIIKGSCYKDERGELRYNNQFHALPVKRIYCISNSESHPVRGWQGHKIEQRWFTAVSGSFEICTIAVDNWETPSADLSIQKFAISQKDLSVLHVPPGYITAIRALQQGSILLAMSDCLLGEVQDDFRFPLKYFNRLFDE